MQNEKMDEHLIQGAGVLGALETGVMATIAGGPSYAIPFGIFGYLKGRHSGKKIIGDLTSIQETANNPYRNNQYRRRLYGKPLGSSSEIGNQNVLFWLLLFFVIISGLAVISMAGCFYSKEEDEDYVEKKKLRRKINQQYNIQLSKQYYTGYNLDDEPLIKPKKYHCHYIHGAI